MSYVRHAMFEMQKAKFKHSGVYDGEILLHCETLDLIRTVKPIHNSISLVVWFNSQSHHAVWKNQSDADNALCVNVLQARDALSQTLSEKDPVYHYLKGSCRDEFDVSNLKSSCRTLYECTHLYCVYALSTKQGKSSQRC